MNIRDIMRASPVMPVIVLDRVDDAVPLARALVEGGIRVLEVTLRTPAALASIKAIAAAVPDAIVGVGTVTLPAQFAEVKAAGARFAVTPGLTAELAQAAKAAVMPLLPGVMTPSEVIAALAHGFDAMKLFPAEQAGGIGMLKAMGGPFADVLFCPTGGVTLESAPKFLALPNVACVGGSWLVPKDKVAAGDWGAITQLARGAAALKV
ncbi:bifunctional 4-hydroxy-2-oxoglutarate aldolase/2-dehydro-3-deoxy-phosphogluconate aldolase [Chitinimonas sp. BJB300]|uniref:bifunctional 4-hydroxy-2-oxoglutarate aldolase/2-dehydro-3-deoxy-phosphogluconate aldolase n=1 Tax=Chitinimonas sp. BJB300 TaxID=1559339 RepID=UPI000C106112|nr:bifunctional 4-hydroxy-2-oxoglutarate aldolase/2-dehydro-3-deoxy-phosphogluconate aldolase [Chitinimonas sp. BJB300]PHV11839.1 keto-deoxy-phosphogluconate aldolase [Chitinimonas sp. BJB300]TSJ88631.1 bifunctional 4-hydroxy-2-oxoglutarate aldolase/2-dehydro-3-deoxy-phosphogluconate aldolase [Chitinimonas sp. BJB300]